MGITFIPRKTAAPTARKSSPIAAVAAGAVTLFRPPAPKTPVYVGQAPVVEGDS